MCLCVAARAEPLQARPQQGGDLRPDALHAVHHPRRRHAAAQERWGWLSQRVALPAERPHQPLRSVARPSGRTWRSGALWNRRENDQIYSGVKLITCIIMGILLLHPTPSLWHVRMISHPRFTPLELCQPGWVQNTAKRHDSPAACRALFEVRHESATCPIIYPSSRRPRNKIAVVSR